MVRVGAVRAWIERAWRRLRDAPRGYTLGIPLVVVGFALMGASLITVVEVISVTTVSGAAPPGTTEQLVAFTLTPLFEASLVVERCGPQFYLLNDLQYEDWLAQGRLPPPTLNCTRTEALVAGRVQHLIKDNPAAPGTADVPFSITVAFWGEAYPYALLSLPGAGVALGGTAWFAKTMLARGTEKLMRERSARPRSKTRK